MAKKAMPAFLKDKYDTSKLEGGKMDMKADKAEVKKVAKKGKKSGK